MNKFLFYLLVLIVIFFSASVLSTPPGPTEQVKGTVDGILEVLKNKELEQASKRKKMRALIDKRFDFRAMSQRTLATNWKKATAKEQERFVELFSKLLEHTYLSRIEAYTDERIDYAAEKVKGKRALIDTLIATGNVDIPINYKLQQKGEEWLVYDVVIEEVSLVQNYRSSYRNIVKREGIDGLLAKMEQKLDELKKSRDKGKAS